jgi:hypothetical protein
MIVDLIYDAIYFCYGVFRLVDVAMFLKQSLWTHRLACSIRNSQKHPLMPKFPLIKSISRTKMATLIPPNFIRMQRLLMMPLLRLLITSIIILIQIFHKIRTSMNCTLQKMEREKRHMKCKPSRQPDMDILNLEDGHLQGYNET